MSCPLCKSVNTKELSSICTKELLTLYKRLTNEDFSYLFDESMSYVECQNCQLRYFSPLITGDEAFYNSLQKFDWYYPGEKSEFLHAKKYINSTDKVLEIGSGRGAFVKHLPTKDYVGLDFSEKARDMAVKDGIIIKNEMIQDYAINNPNIADVVVSFQVLEHVSDPKLFIEGKLAALVDGGLMIVAVPSEDSYLKYATNDMLNMPPHHVSRWSDKTLQYIAEQYNLELLEIYHDKLQNEHKKSFLNTVIASSFLKPKILNTSFLYRVIMSFISLLSSVLVKGLKDEMLPQGHTVMAVYRKNKKP